MSKAGDHGQRPTKNLGTRCRRRTWRLVARSREHRERAPTCCSCWDGRRLGRDDQLSWSAIGWPRQRPRRTSRGGSVADSAPSAAEQAALPPVWPEALTPGGIPADRVRPNLRAEQPGQRLHRRCSHHRGDQPPDARLPRRPHRSAGVGRHSLPRTRPPRHGRSRFGLMITWLSLPWRIAARSVLRIAARLAGWQPHRILLAVIITVFAAAIVQSAGRSPMGQRRDAHLPGRLLDPHTDHRRRAQPRR